MARIKWVFFDIDNTLFDSQRLAAEARKNAVRAMIKAGLKAKPNEAFEKLMSIVKRYTSNYPEHFDRLVAEYDVEKELRAKIIAAGQGEYHNTKFRLLVPLEGGKETLRKLKRRGYSLGIITNGRAVKQWDKIIRLSVSEFFEPSTVIISEDAKAEKPQESIFTYALWKAKCPPHEAIMVGDKEEDMAAKHVGMHVIMVRRGQSFSEILKQVERIEKGR